MEAYTNLVEIGKGSFGTVFKADKQNQTEQYAIKKVRCDAPENVELALQEFWTLSCLQKHRNIIRFEECFLQHGSDIRAMKHGDQTSPSYLYLVEMSIKGECAMSRSKYHLWFVMEYCDGGDMNDYLLSRIPSSTLNASFMTQLADGIAFLHRNSVVHRDLKPENILVRTNSPTGSSSSEEIPTVKIADFGLSKVCASKGQSQVNVNACWLSSACGSDFFMAPEVFEGHYTAKADVFALGIMFWAIMDRITFIDAATKKVLLGTYVRRDKEVLPVGEALLDDPKHNIEELLAYTGRKKVVCFARGKEDNRRVQSASCVAGSKPKLRKLIALMVHPNPDMRPASQELLDCLKGVLQSVINRSNVIAKATTKYTARRNSARLASRSKAKRNHADLSDAVRDLSISVQSTRPAESGDAVTILQSGRKSTIRGHHHHIIPNSLHAVNEFESLARSKQNVGRTLRSNKSCAAKPGAVIESMQRVTVSAEKSSSASNPSTQSPCMADDTSRDRGILEATVNQRETVAKKRTSRNKFRPKSDGGAKSDASRGASKPRRGGSDRILRSAMTSRRRSLRAWCKSTSAEETQPETKSRKSNQTRKKKSPVAVAEIPGNAPATSDHPTASENESEDDEQHQDEPSPQSQQQTPDPFTVAVKKRWRRYLPKSSEDDSQNNDGDSEIYVSHRNFVGNRRRKGTVISILPSTPRTKTEPPASTNTPTMLSPIKDETDLAVPMEEVKRPGGRVRVSLKQQITDSKPAKPLVVTVAKQPVAKTSGEKVALKPAKLRVKSENKGTTVPDNCAESADGTSFRAASLNNTPPDDFTEAVVPSASCANAVEHSSTDIIDNADPIQPSRSVSAPDILPCSSKRKLLDPSEVRPSKLVRSDSGTPKPFYTNATLAGPVMTSTPASYSLSRFPITNLYSGQLDLSYPRSPPTSNALGFGMLRPSTIPVQMRRTTVSTNLASRFFCSSAQSAGYSGHFVGNCIGARPSLPQLYTNKAPNCIARSARLSADWPEPINLFQSSQVHVRNYAREARNLPPVSASLLMQAPLAVSQVDVAARP